MSLSRLSQLPVARLIQLKSKNISCCKQNFGNGIKFRNYASEPPHQGAGFRRAEKYRSFMQMLREPAGETAFVVGKGALAGASAFGLGALCYYGIGLSNEVGAIDRSAIWPDYVRKRIQSTYSYFGGSVAITAVSAYYASRSQKLMQLLTRNTLASALVTLGVILGTGSALMAIPYTDQFGAKQLFWIAHSSLLGSIVAPLIHVGGPIILRAASYTAGLVGALSLVAACAPSEKFLNIGGPLAMGLGVVLVSSLGTFVFPPGTALGAGLYSLSMYGGLILFSFFLLYDTQRIIQAAEWHPPEWSPTYNGSRKFDPVNMSISIYMDTLNIFIRIVHILLLGGGGGGNRGRK